MPTFLPKFVDVDVANPKTLEGFDCIQIKFDGWFCEVSVSSNGLLSIKSKTDRFLKIVGSSTTNVPLVLQGEYIFGTQEAQTSPLKDKVVLYDLVMVENQPLLNLSYRARFAEMMKRVKDLRSRELSIVQNYPMTALDELVQKVKRENLEGLVFRNTELPASHPQAALGRWKQSVTVRAKIVSMKEGAGKLDGMMGSVVVEYESGATGEVGGGFDNQLRTIMWLDPASFIGKWIEVEAKKVFESGNVRHPNFVRFESGQL